MEAVRDALTDDEFSANRISVSWPGREELNNLDGSRISLSL